MGHQSRSPSRASIGAGGFASRPCVSDPSPRDSMLLSAQSGKRVLPGTTFTASSRCVETRRAHRGLKDRQVMIEGENS